MKIKFLATGVAPEFYEFEGEKIKFNGDWYDLSTFEEGDVFEGVEGEIQGIRAIESVEGELYITLCQKAPQGHWTGIDEYIDSEDYIPEALYIREKTSKELQEVGQWEV